jgi:hypothetical protein
MQIRTALVVASSILLFTELADAQPPAAPDAAATQAKREAALADMLRGATLEGSFTNTSTGHDATQLTREKYTLGDVKKLDGNRWLFPTHIQYGDKDIQLPITVPIEWAGDTPVVTVDNVGLPGLGVVSARVMFFADHYAGYWQHGENGGHLFGVIHRRQDADSTTK